jgi:hypothetical protein
MMRDKKTKAPALVGYAGLYEILRGDCTTHPPFKWKRVLAGLILGNTYNRFEAEKALNDHCLHSTISTLQDKGLTVLREYENVPGFKGIPTQVRRYWIAPESLPKALEMLGVHLPLFPANESRYGLSIAKRTLPDSQRSLLSDFDHVSGAS